MGTKLKKSKKTIYIVAFAVCVVSFLVALISVMGASTLNSYTGYLDPDFLQNNGYNNISEFLGSQAGSIFVLSESLQQHIKVWVIIAIVSIVVSLISLIYLVVAVGEKDGAGKICLSRFDRVYTEIQLFAILFILFFGGSLFLQGAERVIDAVYDLDYMLSPGSLAIDVGVTVIGGGLAAALGLGLILSCVKKTKAGEILEQSLCGGLYRNLYKGGSTMRKVTLAALLICLISATVFLAPVIFIFILVFAPKWVKRYDEIKKGLKEVNSGNLDYKIFVEGDDELGQLAKEINQISEATSIAVQNELKNQRMKADLISNVSHDLKTPLTSMVTYIDLLKMEGLQSENAPRYLEILEQKTERLRQLTEDLFEAAKASSGAIPVRMSRVDLLSLLNQALGEMNERVEQSDLEFIINAEKERYFVHADGQLLWRVISNLLGNVLKYSQPHTRVYINFMRRDGEHEAWIFMEMKNISSQALNIEPSELLERFKRGDQARATEGSGLGLAIAKDLMKLMNGQIDIDIDGDLFKIKIGLEAASEDDPIVTPMDFGEMGEDISGMGTMSNAADLFVPPDLPETMDAEVMNKEASEAENTEAPAFKDQVPNEQSAIPKEAILPLDMEGTHEAETNPVETEESEEEEAIAEQEETTMLTESVETDAQTLLEAKSHSAKQSQRKRKSGNDTRNKGRAARSAMQRKKMRN